MIHQHCEKNIMEINKLEIQNYFKEALHQFAPEVIFENLKLNIPLRDQIEIDSLDLYNIIVNLQRKTGVYITDSKLAELLSINDLIEYVFSQNTNREHI